MNLSYNIKYLILKTTHIQKLCIGMNKRVLNTALYGVLYCPAYSPVVPLSWDCQFFICIDLCPCHAKRQARAMPMSMPCQGLLRHRKQDRQISRAIYT